MKKTKNLTILILLLFAALALTGCRGSGAVASSWPGITIEGDQAIVAFNTGIYAIDLSDGSLDTTYPSNAGDLKNAPFFHAPLALDEDTLLAGSYNNKLYQISTRGGAASEFFTSARNRWIATPLVQDGVIYAPNANGSLYALDMDANELWSFDTDAAIWSTPVIDNGQIFVVSQDHFLYAVDKQSGNLNWSFDMGAAAISRPVLSEDGVLYVGSFASKVYAVDSKTGSLLWEKEVDGWVWGTPALGPDNLLLVTDMSGTLTAFDRETQKKLWTKQVAANSPITGSALVVGEAIFVVTQSGTIASYDLEGERLWKEDFGTEDDPIEFHGTPVLAAEGLILVSAIGAENGVYAFNAELESEWQFVPEN